MYIVHTDNQKLSFCKFKRQQKKFINRKDTLAKYLFEMDMNWNGIQ